MNSLIEQYSHISKYSSTKATAMAAIIMSKSFLENFVEMVIGQIFGRAVRSLILKVKRDYIVLSDKKLNYLTFKDDVLESNNEIDLADIKDVEIEDKDEIQVKIKFDANGKKYDFKVFKYQFTDIDGTYMTASEDMQKVADMVKHIAKVLTK